MSAPIEHEELSEAKQYQLKATLYGLNGRREELRLEEIAASADLDHETVRKVMKQLENDPDSPIVKVSDGVWWTRD